MANTAMSLWRDPQVADKASFPKWSYDEGILLLYPVTGEKKYGEAATMLRSAK